MKLPDRPLPALRFLAGAVVLVGLSEGSRRALQLMLRHGVIGLGLLWALHHAGPNTTALLAVAGGLFEGAVRPGEVLFIDGDPCEVRSLGLRAAVWRCFREQGIEMPFPQRVIHPA